MSDLALAALVGLPFAIGLVSLRTHADRATLAVRVSIIGALAMTLLATLTPVDVALVLPSGRSLVFSPIAQLGLQLLGLFSLGLTFALAREPAQSQPNWLSVTWFHVGGLVVALLLNSLPLALLAFTAATLLWAFALPEQDRRAASGPVLRYAALLALAMPLLLGALQIAEARLTSDAGRVAVEHTVLALALPGFGLVLGLVPLHAWTLTLAAGAPRPMLFGVLGLAQTAGFALLLRTVDLHEWLFRGAYGSFVTLGGAITALVGAWLALSSHPDDPDDWLAYAVVANMGMLVAGVGTGSRAAATGVAILLLARVLALVLLALKEGAGERASRLADAAATLTLAGTPPLAGFAGFFLILTGARSVSLAAAIALVAGSALLMATAVRRWMHATRSTPRGSLWQSGPDRTVLVLVLVLLILGLAPQLVAGALLDPLRDIFFPDTGLPGL